MYIRKVKKSESKSQLRMTFLALNLGLCISVKLKNLKANHNLLVVFCHLQLGCVYP